MSFAPFVPLRVFSSYTLLGATIDPDEIATIAKQQGFPAIAICDRNGLYGTVYFANACRKAGVQPIIGTFLAIARDDKASSIDWLALFAQNETGWNNLSALVSKAHLDRPVELEPHVYFSDLATHHEGLLALTGGAEGAMAKLLAEGQSVAAGQYCDRLQKLFPDRLYIELNRMDNPVEEASEAGLIDLAYARDLPLVATNPANFSDPGYHAAHDAMLCIANATYIDSHDRPRSQRQAFVKSAPMMLELFEDLPEATANTLVIAKRCAVAPPSRKPILPSLAGDAEGEIRMLAADARTGLQQRLSAYSNLTDEEYQTYKDRLEFEIEIITRMGFCGYFLIVADFIKWAKEHDIPVGPGRGSGAGSVVAWCLTITDLDPIRLGLLFERFLNPERVSMPDFDIDFCETRRGEVIRYVQKKYGHDHVAQIITFGTMKARAVLRDAGRILQMSYGQVDRLCKMIPNHPTDPWTLRRTLDGLSEFRQEYEKDDSVRRLVDLSLQLEGKPRNSSTHAAGVVIGDRPLAELVPLYRDPRSDMPVTQFGMKHVEQTGLVKFDFLGLKTLSVLRKAIDLLQKRGIAIDLDHLSWDDEDVYALLQRGNTVGVFQLESEGMRRTLAAVKPTNFGDIIALVSLYRPGPMDNIPLFGRRKNGLESIEFPHEKLKPILEETYGIFVYQEQVMQAAQVLAGYSLGDADLLRRAMGKKIKAEMDAQRSRFVKGCHDTSDIPEKQANELFDLIDKFAGYGFNKSHAAAYALLAYQTAWLKAHYPHEFYAAAMCFDMHQSEKLAVFVDDMRRNGLKVAGPDINYSEAEFTVEEADDGHVVRYALAGLRNVGEKAMDAIVLERQERGLFTSIQELFERLPHGSMNRRQLEALASAGAFDSLEANRAMVMASADLLLAVADEAERIRISGQGGLFSDDGGNAASIKLVNAATWNRSEQMAKEKESFGFYFAEHPVEQYRQIASARGARSYISLTSTETNSTAGRQSAVMACMVEDVRKRRTRKGREFVIMEFSDQSGQFSASCFEEGLTNSFIEWRKDGTCLLLDVELDSPNPEEPPRITIRGARPLSDIHNSTQMLLKVDIDRIDAVQSLAMLLPHNATANGEVRARLVLSDGKMPTVCLGTRFELDGDLVDHLSGIEGISNVSLGAKKGKHRHLRVVS